MPTQAKIDQVEEISAHFRESANCWFIDARGLTVKESQQLRRDIRAAGGSMHVYKNNLAAIALKNLGLPTVPEVLSGPTAFVFSGDDIAATAKAIKEFSKGNELLELKGGIVDGAEVSAEEALRIAELPSKDVLLAMLLSAMQAPITGLARVCAAPAESLARALNQVAEKAA